MCYKESVLHISYVSQNISPKSYIILKCSQKCFEYFVRLFYANDQHRKQR